MDKFTASEAKQHFGQLLERAVKAPVGIERHGKLVAVLAPPEWAGPDAAMAERRRAREQQQRLETDRLLAHQKIGIELLGHKDRRARLLQAARAEVARWSSERLCSHDYIDRWSEWLALPAVELVERMCSNADGWGPAMRQNSPFAAAAR